ncbi:MAG: hypothetical protein RIR90_287 [Bacteroidota bacterium]
MTMLMQEFTNFRNAVYQGNIRATKSFMEFPVMNTNNDIWYVVLNDQEQQFRKINSRKIIPFTEADMTLYYRKIFPKAFVISLLKINTDTLFKKGSASSYANAEDSITNYSMDVFYDKEVGRLSLNLFYRRQMKDSYGNDVKGDENNVIYNFKIKRDGRLLFDHIRIAAQTR